MTARFLPLSAVGAADAPLVGAKAAALGEALAAGEPVPPGVVLTPACLEAVLGPAGLLDAWRRALDAARLGDFAPAEALVPGVAGAAWPPEVSQAVMAAIHGLGRRLAVRSSATVEDAPDASAAGVFHTELDVASDDLPRAAQACWAALIAPATLGHLLALGHDPAAVGLALLIQPMLAPRAAGVLFTVDPVDAERRHMRLAIAAGLGAAVVDGELGRDVRLPRTGAVADVTSLPRADAEALRPLALGLPRGGARRLRDMGLRLERRADRPLDIEWAWVDAAPVLLQARPIVGLAPGSQRRPPIRWSRDLAEERYPDPISPLGWSALQSALRVNIASLERRFGLAAERPDEVARTIGAHVYNNRDFFKVPGSLRFRVAAHRPYLGGYARVLLSLLSPASLAHARLAFAPRRGPLAAGPNDPRLRAACGVFEAFVLTQAAEIERSWRTDFPRHMAAMDALVAEDPQAMDRAGQSAYARRLIAASDAFLESDLAIYLIKTACGKLAAAIAAMVDGHDDPSLVATLTGGLESNATAAMNAELERLVAAVAADAYLSAALRHADVGALRAAWDGSPARPLRDAFLRAYGHLGHSWDLRDPPLVERPEVLDGMLAARLRAGPPAGEDRRGALLLARERTIERIMAGLAPAPWAPPFFRRLIDTLHAFVRLDEEQHLMSGRLIPAERRLIAVWANELAAQGVLGQPDDVWFLELDELLAIMAEPAPHTRRHLVARRRAAYERAAAMPPVAEYAGDVPVGLAAVVPAAGDALRGEGASPGVAEGPVRHVACLADLAAVCPGEIVVVPTPKPAFTPAFALAAGVVAARGSLLSHGLVLAREYGLPAVTGIPDALARLPEGTRVRIDGVAGTVTPVESAAATPASSRGRGPASDAGPLDRLG